MNSIKQQLLRYWLAMNASAFDSMVIPLKTYVGTAIAHAASESIPALTLQQAGYVFLAAFGMGLLNYLQANPIEKLFPSDSAVEPGTGKP